MQSFRKPTSGTGKFTFSPSFYKMSNKRYDLIDVDFQFLKYLCLKACDFG